MPLRILEGVSTTTGLLPYVKAPDAIGKLCGREANGVVNATDFIDVEAVELVRVAGVGKSQCILIGSSPIVTPDLDTAKLEIFSFDPNVDIAPAHQSALN